MIRRVNRTDPGVLQYPLHAHRSYEIMLYLEGVGYMRTEQGDVPFRPGTVVIVPPNVRHGSVSEAGFVNVSIEGTFEKYLPFEKVTALCDDPKGDGKVLAEMIYENRYAAPAYLSALCTAFVCFLMQRFETEGSVRDRVRGIVLEISEHALDSEIDLTKILSDSGYSEDYVRAQFKNVVGKTPHEFLTEIRIRHACFLIEVYGSDLSLAEIAERCGYTDYVYFSKKFKSVTGRSPRAYRKP